MFEHLYEPRVLDLRVLEGTERLCHASLTWKLVPLDYGYWCPLMATGSQSESELLVITVERLAAYLGTKIS